VNEIIIDLNQLCPPTYQAVLHPDKVYLLVGCLGGLGRSLSRWMLSRGARNFVFMGRSGSDKPSAEELLVSLRASGAHVTVVRGDISKASDVDNAVQACLSVGVPIGGVVQAAMGLHEELFSTMSCANWHKSVQPKWAGSWNLDKSLEGLEDALDFLVLTSSMAGSIGLATEGNYCAANAFLDAFAHWRRTQGKTAISVGLGMISEVGHT
jgi:NAD(P)-dependent dehydrogenase (short-subunit alcohol dehydrogenase family)